MNKNICEQVDFMIDKYLSKCISGEELAGTIRINLDALEGISDDQRNSIGYYENFFEMEGKDLYEPNKYVDEEISEFRVFLKTLYV